MYQEPYRDQDNQAYYEDVPPGHTQPYPPPPASLRLSEPPPAPSPRHGVPWLALACCVVSIASLLLAAYVWSAQSSVRDTAARQAAQIAQLRQTLARAQSGNAKTISGLAGQVSGMGSALNAMAPYSKICSTDLTRPNGPAEFFFLCTDQKP